MKQRFGDGINTGADCVPCTLRACKTLYSYEISKLVHFQYKHLRKYQILYILKMNSFSNANKNYENIQEFRLLG